MTDSLPAGALVLNPRVGGFAYILRPCKPCKRSFLKIWQFPPLPQPPLLYIARSNGDLSSWCWSPGLCSLAWGWDCSLLFPIFIHHTWMWDHLCPFCHCFSMPHTSPHLSNPSPCLCPSYPIWMNVASLNPLLLDFHTNWFSDSSGCYLFWDLVVIPFCGWVRRQSISTYASSLTKSLKSFFFPLITLLAELIFQKQISCLTIGYVIVMVSKDLANALTHLYGPQWYDYTKYSSLYITYTSIKLYFSLLPIPFFPASVCLFHNHAPAIPVTTRILLSLHPFIHFTDKILLNFQRTSKGLLL